MSAKGHANTNGPVSGDRDKGLERAGDRAGLHAQAQPGSHVNRGHHNAYGKDARSTRS